MIPNLGIDLTVSLSPSGAVLAILAVSAAVVVSAALLRRRPRPRRQAVTCHDPSAAQEAA